MSNKLLGSLSLLIGLLLSHTSFGQLEDVDTNIRVNLEEPSASVTYGGISNLRGWAVAPSGIDRVEIFIDGTYAFDVPMGGSRGDVGNAYPDYVGSDRSGFSAAYNYKGLTRGIHTMTARAYSNAGTYNETSSIFNTVTFSSDFLSDLDSIDLTSTDSVSLLNSRAFRFSGVTVEGSLWEIDFAWDRATQGFEIVDIFPYQEVPQCADLSGYWALDVTGQSVAEGAGYRVVSNYDYAAGANISQDGCAAIYTSENVNIPPIPFTIYGDTAYGRAPAPVVGELIADEVEAIILRETGYSSSAAARFAYAEVTAVASGNFAEGRQRAAASGTVTVGGNRYTWVYSERFAFTGNR